MPFPSYILRPLAFSISILMIEWGVLPTLFIFIALLSLIGTEIKKTCFAFKLSKSLILFSSSILSLMAIYGILNSYVRTPDLWILFYLPWSVFQEFVVFCFIYENLENAVKEPKFIVSIIFSIFHIPNVFLVFTTFLMILIFSSYYRRYRTIALPAILHYAFAVTALIFLPENITHALKVGVNCCK